MRFNELTIFKPTIPTWDCVSLRVHRTSQTIPRKDLQKEMNEKFELITVTISLAATAMNENNRRTATGKPAFSWVMQSMSRHVILPRAFVGHLGRREEILPSCALKHLWNKTSFGLFHLCPPLQRCLFRPYNLGLDEHPHKRKVGIFFSSLISTKLASIFSFYLRFIYRLV